MLAALLNVPNSPQDWNVWSFNNRTELTRIRTSIRQKLNVNLPEYQLDPIAFNAVTLWQLWNQQAHQDFNGALQLPSVDLEGADFSDRRQLEAWIWLNYQEVRAAEAALGV